MKKFLSAEAIKILKSCSSFHQVRKFHKHWSGS